MSRIRSAGIVLQNNAVLLMDRKRDGKEFYTFPGGGVEEGENAARAAVREIDEETSIAVSAERLLYTIYFEGGDEEYFYLTEYISGEPKLREDSIEKEREKIDQNFYTPLWVPVNDLPNIILYPLEIRDWVSSDLPEGFAREVRELRIAREDLRKPSSLL